MIKGYIRVLVDGHERDFRKRQEETCYKSNKKGVPMTQCLTFNDSVVPVKSKKKEGV